MHDKIAFNISFSTEKESTYVHHAVMSGKTSGCGHYTNEAQKILSNLHNSAEVILTTSCTHTLEMSAMLLNIQPGDEVIFPSFTFVSTVNAFILRGAIPRFADIRNDTLNIDIDKVQKLITEKTKAIVPVHYAGVAVDMDELLVLSSTHNIPVIEDNAHGLFASYKNKPLGTFGDMSVLSFHDTKNITCGEGGALVVNNPVYRKRAEILRDKGTDRSRFLRGEVDKYSWVDVGSSYAMSDVLAAYLLGQLERSVEIQQRRQFIWNYYQEHLASWCQDYSVIQPHIPHNCTHPAHLYYLRFPIQASESMRDRFIQHMKNNGIQTPFHYIPLHSSEMGKSFGYSNGDLPITETVAESLIRLPLHLHLRDSDLERIVSAVTSFRIQ